MSVVKRYRFFLFAMIGLLSCTAGLANSSDEEKGLGAKQGTTPNNSVGQSTIDLPDTDSRKGIKFSNVRTIIVDTVPKPDPTTVKEVPKSKKQVKPQPVGKVEEAVKPVVKPVEPVIKPVIKPNIKPVLKPKVIIKPAVKL